MAWMQLKTRIFNKSINRTGSISKKMLFIWCMLTSVIVYLMPQNSSNKFQLAFAHVFRVPLSAGRKISLDAGTQQNLKDTVSMKLYEELENRYHNLEQTLIEQRRQFIQLTELNDYIGKNVAYILGYVITSPSNNMFSELTIQCLGTKGLENGQFVLARNNSVLGRISYIAPQMRKAKVRLITDTDSKIAVRIDGLDQDLIMQGNGDSLAIIRNVDSKEKITPGQEVFALMEPGFTDSDLIIGTVSKCVPDDKNRLLWEITVEPAWNIEELKEIAIIIHNQQK